MDTYSRKRLGYYVRSRMFKIQNLSSGLFPADKQRTDKTINFGCCSFIKVDLTHRFDYDADEPYLRRWSGRRSGTLPHANHAGKYCKHV